MINDSFKNIAKIIENSSKENKNDNHRKIDRNKTKHTRFGGKDSKPPYYKYKSAPIDKRNKTVSIDSKDEKKLNLPEVDFDIGWLEADNINKIHSFIEIPKRRLTFSDPLINSKQFIENNNGVKYSKTISKPRMAYSWDKMTMNRILVGKIRDRLKKEI